jgi:hypothetical protein
MSKILDSVRKAILRGDKSRYSLSKETGIDQAQLSRFMSGSGAMSFENLELLARALGLEIIVRQVKPATNKRKER